MADKEIFEDEQKDRQDSRPPDIWYKLRSAGGIATAVMVAVIGTAGSYVMNKQQTLATRAQLYTELMSQRENAESSVRKDMFQQILSSFLTKPTGSVCILEQIDEELLRLELLARNFHEMLDMEPLFLHVLLKIVREIPRLPEPTLSHDKALASTPATPQERLYALWKGRPGADMAWKDFKIKTMRRKLDRLIRIANRITKKQLESLSSVQIRQRLTINLSKTCQDMRPTEPLEHDCDMTGAVDKPNFLMHLEGGVKRKFTVAVGHSYPLWNQVRVKVEVQKTAVEKRADPNGKDVHLSQFWLGYFDFPLAENTFLSDKERYAVVLDEIDLAKQQAIISVLYFPASYAGLKEKSFYQQKLISTLLEKKSF